MADWRPLIKKDIAKMRRDGWRIDIIQKDDPWLGMIVEVTNRTYGYSMGYCHQTSEHQHNIVSLRTIQRHRKKIRDGVMMTSNTFSMDEMELAQSIMEGLS